MKVTYCDKSKNDNFLSQFLPREWLKLSPVFNCSRRGVQLHFEHLNSTNVQSVAAKTPIIFLKTPIIFLSIWTARLILP